MQLSVHRAIFLGLKALNMSTSSSRFASSIVAFLPDCMKSPILISESQTTFNKMKKGFRLGTDTCIWKKYKWGFKPGFQV